MNKDKVIDEFIKVSSGFFKTLEGAKDYSKERLKNSLNKSLEKFDFIKREELEEVREMCIKAREENSKLFKKIKILEKKLKKSN